MDLVTVTVSLQWVESDVICPKCGNKLEKNIGEYKTKFVPKPIKIYDYRCKSCGHREQRKENFLG